MNCAEESLIEDPIAAVSACISTQDLPAAAETIFS